MEEKKASRGVLYVISCGSSFASLTFNFVVRTQIDGWDTCVITTPNGKKFLNVPQLSSQTGHVVRSEYKQPDEPDLLPRADAIVVFPCTFNTTNKWALGISDTLAVGLLSEYTGLGVPIVAVIWTGQGLDVNPALHRSIKMLKRYGISVLFDTSLRANPQINEIVLHLLYQTIEIKGEKRGQF